jgi:hypothetical protein
MTVLLLAVVSAPKAATVDLTGFTLVTGTNSSETTSANASEMVGTASLGGVVTNLSTFNWNFTAGDINVGGGLLNDYAYFTTTAGSFQLADIAAVGSYGTTGWETYTFATPYSGNIIFGVANVTDDENASTLKIRNLTTVLGAVPEPQTYALLLSGLGFMGTVMRRRLQRRATN